jgi:hypothetical protein
MPNFCHSAAGNCPYGKDRMVRPEPTKDDHENDDSRAGTRLPTGHARARMGFCMPLW